MRRREMNMLGRQQGPNHGSADTRYCAFIIWVQVQDEQVQIPEVEQHTDAAVLVKLEGLQKQFVAS